MTFVILAFFVVLGRRVYSRRWLGNTEENSCVFSHSEYAVLVAISKGIQAVKPWFDVKIKLF